MTPEQRQLIVHWVKAWAADDNPTMAAIDGDLKATGIWAYENSAGFPTVNWWYNGPLKPGMIFVWDPDGAAQLVKVSRITPNGNDPMVWCKTETGRYRQEVYNEESYFRSKVVLRST